MRSEEERLRDVLEAIDRIEKYATQGRSVFERDELIQNWIVSHLRIIGEACRGLSDDFHRDHPDIPWASIIGMRNILVHHYFDIDVDIVWRVIEDDLPDLKMKVQAALDT